jgi:signal peptidase I
MAFLLGFLARLGDEHPLILGGGLFLAFSETVRYWRRRWMRSVSRAVQMGAPEPGSEAGGKIPIGRGGPSPATKAEPRTRETLRLAGILVGAILLALGMRGFLGEVHRVLGASMAPTLNAGDRLLVNKLAYGLRVPFSSRRLWASAPRRGDVIVFPNPNLDRDLGRRDGADLGPRTLVKRIIGLPGDVIAFRDGSPMINGWVVPSCDAGPYLSVSGRELVRGRLAVEVLGDRTYLTIRPPAGEPPTLPFQIPPGEVYVIGDDRSVSQDSRAWRAAGDGHRAGVPIASIEGRVSRLAVGASRDGRLDLVHPLAGLRPVLRQPNLDLTALERRIAGCLAHPPRSSSPPPAAASPGPQPP